MNHELCPTQLRSPFNKFGIVFLEHLSERGWSPVFQRVNVLDKSEDVGAHDEQISHSFRARVPICVRSSAPNEYTGAGVHLHVIFADLNAKRPFYDIPGFIIAVVEVPWGDQTPLANGTSRILPLRDYKSVGNGTHDLSSKRRSNRR